MKKILIINTIGYAYEGISSVINNYVRNMGRSQANIYIVKYPNSPQKLIRDMSDYANFVELPSRKRDTKGYFKSLHCELKKEYDVVHINGNSSTMALECFLCKIHHVKRIIVHNHGFHTEHPFVNTILHLLLMCLSDIKLASSIDAGRWLYKKDFFVLNNAIMLEKFKYNVSNRLKIRDMYNLSDEIVIGHIGHFTSGKNHELIIDFFNELIKKNNRYRLMLISDGPLFERIKNKVKELDLENYVYFVGRTDKPEEYYSAMDIFVMPSQYESFGMVLLEAQANGLDCIASNTIPTAVNCTGKIKYTSINDCSYWVDEIDNTSSRIDESERMQNSEYNIETIIECGYDIRCEASKLLGLYGV